MKKVIIRRDMVTKAILNAVDNAIEDVDFKVGVKVVSEISRNSPTGDRIIEAVQAYAVLKGVPSEVRYWGDGTVEVRLADNASAPSDSIEYCDKSNPCHY